MAVAAFCDLWRDKKRYLKFHLDNLRLQYINKMKQNVFNLAFPNLQISVLEIYAN